MFNAQQSTPYQHSHPVDPLGVYGASKADGGLAVLEHAVAGAHHWSDAGAASWYEFDLAVTTVLCEPPG